MSIIVQKFGGTSVADCDKIRAAARKAIRTQQTGHQVVMVVSAMGKNTDMLVNLAEELNDSPPAREMDMLLSTGEQVSVALMAMAIDAMGHKGVSLTGGQIGIKTDSSHTKARIRSISTARMQWLLDAGNIVIAAGFQGIDEDFNITTLGRGGSDTTAVALAAVLGAERCEIYTDVDGIYTTDPRIVPEAHQMPRISYDEMLELASLGAGVMHSRSIEFAKKYGVPIQVRSSISDSPGTLIGQESNKSVSSVTGAALTKNEGLITVSGVPDVPGTNLEMFSSIADRNISVDMIVQNIGENGLADISFTVPTGELASTLEAVETVAEKLSPVTITQNDQVSKVSAVGQGMAHQSGVAHQMFLALGDAGINMLMITTSEIKISALVERKQAQNALRAVHRAFELHEASSQPDAIVQTQSQPSADALDVVHHLQGVDMEELFINNVSVDESQSRVTIHGIPDTPGIAAKVFHEIAAASVFVDMVVQSYSGNGNASLSFTVSADSLGQSLQIAQDLARTFQCERVSSNPRVGKLSVSGVGLRSHTGVATRIFRSLAKAEINVQMVSTSEVQVNVVVEHSEAQRGLKCLKSAFDDVLR